MKRIIRLTENDLTRLVKRVIRESKDEKFKLDFMYDFGAENIKSIESATFHPNHRNERIKHLTIFREDLENENWNSNNGIIIFKYDDEVYVAPDCTNGIAKDYLEKHFGYRNERIGVPSFLAQSDSWYSKDVFRRFTQPCR
jgi:hypothetical protein